MLGHAAGGDQRMEDGSLVALVQHAQQQRPQPRVLHQLRPIHKGDEPRERLEDGVARDLALLAATLWSPPGRWPPRVVTVLLGCTAANTPCATGGATVSVRGLGEVGVHDVARLRVERVEYSGRAAGKPPVVVREDNVTVSASAGGSVAIVLKKDVMQPDDVLRVSVW